MSRRYTTIHDLTSLRVHPDGTRVPSSSTRPTTDNFDGANTRRSALRPRLAAYTIKDRSGEWTARDAGGVGTVRRRVSRKAASPSASGSQDEEEFDLSIYGDDPEAGEVEEDKTDKGKGKGQKRRGRGKEVKDPRAKKRRRFMEDLGFLDGPSPVHAHTPSSTPGISRAGDDLTRLLPQSGVSSGSDALPSSDLLKAIHHFASQYYSSRGQLFDGSREARRERKRARLERLNKKETARGKGKGKQAEADVDKERESSENESSTEKEDRGEFVRKRRERVKRKVGDEQRKKGAEGAQVEEGEGIGGESGDDYREDDDEVEEDQMSSSDDQSEPTTKKRRRKKGRDKALLKRDMYKAFDGSALVALGMLIEEHVKSLLTPNIPEGWEEEMEAYHVAELTGNSAEVGDEVQSAVHKTTKGKGKGKRKRHSEGGENRRRSGRRRKHVIEDKDVGDDSGKRSGHEEDQETRDDSGSEEGDEEDEIDFNVTHKNISNGARKRRRTTIEDDDDSDYVL